ncbi:MAG: transglycosylase domain-containing protein, partial [Kofleriaceae bacterium]|nr:transglycosylase domain-containing protein [Kofleriaceae bacterium]
ASATGELSLRRANVTVQFAIDGAVTGLFLDHKTIAPRPVPVDGTLDASLTVSPTAVAVDHANLTIGAAAWTASGWLRRGSPISGQLDLKLAPASCMSLVHSIPVELRGPLDGIAMTGTFGGHARLSIDLAAPQGDGVELDTQLANGCIVTAEPPAADVMTLVGVSDHTFPDGSHGRVGPEEPTWFALRRLRSYVWGAFVSAEDGRFFSHPGFDTVQIARSFEIDLRDGRLARGGSTISQQLIKNSFLTQRRSLDRKVQEALLTWRLEARLEKETILERYLNIIELGPHMFGIRAAAAYWFGKSPRELTVHEAAFLAALTSEPTTMTRRIRRAGTLDADSAARVDIILRAMRRDGVISTEEFNAARAQPLWFSAAALRRET